jgi:hypothetical protein
MGIPITMTITLSAGVASARFPDRDRGWNAGEDLSDSVVLDYDGGTGQMTGFTLSDFPAGAEARVPLAEGDLRGGAVIGGATPWLYLRRGAAGLALWAGGRESKGIFLRGFRSGRGTVQLWRLFSPAPRRH